MDSIVYARSAPPVNVVTGKNPFGNLPCQEPTACSGRMWFPACRSVLADPNAAGGKIINKAAFSIPASGQGDLGRNALRGFGASQVDLTLQRQFKLSERFSLQASADLFNIFNHPNFGPPDQLPDFSSVRAVDADAEQLSGQRRPERRPQSAVPDRRPALGATGAEAAVLNCHKAALFGL